MLKSEIGNRKTENGKRKTERFSEYSEFSDYSEYSESSDYSESSASPATQSFPFSVLTLSSLLPLGIEVNFIALAYSQPSHFRSLSQRLYVVYNGIRAVQQVLAQFLEELLAGTGLYV